MTPLPVRKINFWFLFSLTIAIIIVISGILELFARTPVLSKVSPFRSVGLTDYQFETKWFKLQDFVKQNEGVDIIVLGSSLVNTGIDPDIVSKTYYAQTGVHPRIFNFGVEGMTIAPNSVTAGLLVERYHPALLIYVTEMRDYIAGNGLMVETPFLNDPWLRDQLGYFTFSGWIIDHSAALQHYLPYRNWMRADFLDTMAFYLRRYHDTSASGYEPDSRFGVNIDVPPDPNDPLEAQNFKDFGNYQVSPARLGNLKSILDLGHDQQTAVMVVEMPVHPTFYVYVGGEKVHAQFQETISTFVTINGGSFLPAEACFSTIPLFGRFNRWHLNFRGAPLFSNCLGGQLAILTGQHAIDIKGAGSLK